MKEEGSVFSRTQTYLQRFAKIGKASIALTSYENIEKLLVLTSRSVINCVGPLWEPTHCNLFWREKKSGQKSLQNYRFLLWIIDFFVLNIFLNFLTSIFDFGFSKDS